MDSALIEKLELAEAEGLLDYENGIGVDGDGFHYDTIKVPFDSTPESLGIQVLDPADFDNL